MRLHKDVIQEYQLVYGDHTEHLNINTKYLYTVDPQHVISTQQHQIPLYCKKLTKILKKKIQLLKKMLKNTSMLQTRSTLSAHSSTKCPAPAHIDTTGGPAGLSLPNSPLYRNSEYTSLKHLLPFSKHKFTLFDKQYNFYQKMGLNKLIELLEQPT